LRLSISLEFMTVIFQETRDHVDSVTEEKRYSHLHIKLKLELGYVTVPSYFIHTRIP
jgi:hypothetical protein